VELALDHPPQLVERLVRRQPAEQLRGRRQRRERIAQLMREHREKLVLAPVRALERLLRKLALRDVDDRADIALELAAGAEARRRSLQNPTILAVVPPDPELVAERLEPILRRLKRFLEAGPVLRMHDLEPPGTEAFRRRDARELVPRTRQEDARPFRRSDPDHERRVVRELA